MPGSIELKEHAYLNLEEKTQKTYRCDLWRGSFGYDEIDFTMKKAWQISTNVIEPPYYVQDIIRKGLNNNIVIYKETYSDVNRGPGCTWNVQSYYNIQK